MAARATKNSSTLFKTQPVAMPEGDYAPDQPNRSVGPFVETHVRTHGYDPEADDYNVKAFSKPIETTKIDPVYNLHPYDSKKSYLAVKQYIQHYCKAGDLVLDPFCGSGSTLVAASSEGCA